ncbi:MAG: PE family protein, partial [Acidimicrobiales bacterium]
MEPAWAAAAGDRAPSPGTEGRFTSPLAVRVGLCGGSVSHAGGSDSPGAGASKTDLEGETGWSSDDRAAGSTGPHAGAGGATGSGGQGTGCGSRAGGDGSAGPP